MADRSSAHKAESMISPGWGSRLLSPHEVAEYLGVPRGTLYSWRYRGSGPPAMRVGRHLRYRQSDIEKWLDEQRDPR